jgi:hypothetical protein
MSSAIAITATIGAITAISASRLDPCRSSVTRHHCTAAMPLVACCASALKRRDREVSSAMGILGLASWYVA